MTTYFFLKVIHIVGTTLLFGTGLGSAFFMLAAYRAGDMRAIHATARHVVLADWLFTTPAVIVQPVTGYLLMAHLGYSFQSGWFYLTAILYLVAGLCWIPVVFLQLRVRRLASAHLDAQEVPAAIRRLMTVWMALGVPAFTAVLALFWLMVYKPWLTAPPP